MKKNPKESFGIVQDGHSIRIVHLKKDGKDTYLMGMDTLIMERDWYKIEEVDPAEKDTGFVPIEPMFDDFDDFDAPRSRADERDEFDEFGEFSEMRMDEEEGEPEGEAKEIPPMQVSPVSLMLAKFSLNRGVISVNVNEQHIEKDEPGKIKKAEQNKFRKEVLTAAQRKAGLWKSCIIEGTEGKQTWLHTGPNLLLDAIIDYGKESRTKLYFQYADANDLVLKEYFHYVAGDAQSGLYIVLYLGMEYRKAFVFENGVWKDVIPVFIPQEDFEPDIVYSKLALALDSAQLGEPEKIYLAGEGVTSELLEYFKAQSLSSEVELMTYPSLININTEESEYDNLNLAPYTLALAVACKGLNGDPKIFAASNFLPNKILDAQKEFRIAWHGFIVLLCIFIMGTYTTMQNLAKQKMSARLNREMRSLEFRLNTLRAQNTIVEQLTTDIAKYEEINRQIVQSLDGKNRWTELFNILNSAFSSYPESWLSNLKQEEGMLSLTGTTTKRQNVTRICDKLPGGAVLGVTMGEIHGRKVWNFEMSMEMPEVNWSEIIAEGYLLATSSGSDAQRGGRRYFGAGKRVVAAQKEESKGYVYRFGKLNPMDHENTPAPVNNDVQQDDESYPLYVKFVNAVNRGNMLDYQLVGHALITKYPNTRFASLISWWVSYRLYLDGEYEAALRTIRPILIEEDFYYPDSLLLDARLSFAMGDRTFKDKFELLLNRYPQSPAARQGRKDLKLIEEELKR